MKKFLAIAFILFSALAKIQGQDYTVGVTASPVIGGMASGGGTFSSGTSVTVTATPNSGYSFVNWTEGATEVSISASYTFPVTADRTLVANFSQITYTVSVSASPGAGGTVGGGGTYNSGASATVTATPNAGYTFVNWTVSGAEVSTTTSYTFPVTANRTLVANFSQITYTVSVSASPGAGGTVGGGGTYNSGASATVTATPNAGYTFVNWTVSGAEVSTTASYTFPVTANRTLVANFSQITYTVSVSASPGAGGTVGGGGTYNSGTSATVTATLNAGYTFVNWTVSGAEVSTTASYTFPVTANRTLVANFSQITYTVSVSASPGAGGTVGGGGTYNSGTSATVTATPNAGYTFVNWTVSGAEVSTTTSYTFPVTANRTLVANFSQITYTISVSASPGAGGTVGGGGTYNSGTSATVTATPNAGYTFVNWTVSGAEVSTTASYTFPVTANRTLVANFSQITYTVSVSASPGAGGTVGGGGTYNSGASATVTATPNAGYTFVNWTVSGAEVSTTASYTFPVTANRTLVANFSQITYTVSVSASPGAGGTVGGGGTYNSGTSATVTATPNTGYTFVNWTVSGAEVSTTASYTFPVTANRTLVANFSQITYTVSVSASPGAGGTVGGGGTYNSGTSATVTATPNTGYTFVNWTVSGAEVSTTASYTFPVTANRTLVANFSQITYTVSVSASPGAGGTVGGGGTYNSGASATVTATPNAGYTFVNWTVSGAEVSTTASYTFPVTADRTLVANFSQITYTVSVSASPGAGGTVGGGGTYNSGASATVTATPNAGYTFVNWTVSGAEVSTTASYTFPVTANRTLVANFSLNTYTIITSSSPTGGGTTSGGGTFNYGTSMTLVATPNTNYTFVNWTDGGTIVSTNTSYSFTLSANRTLVANFSLNTYTVSTSFSPVGSGTTSGGGTFNAGTSVTVTALPNTGYVFVNWTEGGTAVSTNASYTFTILANRTLVANFSLLTYTIATSSSPALGGTTSGGGSYTYGATATVTATPATGYQFVNWTQAGSAVSTSASYAFPVSANKTLVANFSLISYTINTTSSPTGGGSTSGGGTLNYGTSATVIATPATGYQFVNWTEGGSAVSTNTSYTFIVNANRSLLANFSLINYTVSTSSSPSAGGTTSGAGTYSYGSSATVTASPATGYLFANWTEGGTVVSTNISFTFTVTGNRSVVANYNLITYTVGTASTPTAGGTTAGGGTYNPGTSATVTATPASGYLFVNWTEGGTAVSTNQSYTFLVYANRSLVATFQSITYITINTLSSPSGGGTTSGAGTFPANSQITVHATAATGYNFINWTEGGSAVSASESYTFTVTANRTLVANFGQLSYTVSTSSSPSGSGSTSGGGSYNYGNEVTVTSTPAAGYQFVNWTQGGSSVSTNSSYTFTVGGNRTLVANFTLISYTVSTSSSPSGGGTTNGGGTYTYNDGVTVTATPAGGYNFVNWTQGGSSVSTSASYTFTVTSSRTLVANFSQIIYTVSISSSPAAGGSASGGGTYGSGSSATVTATPATGYLFVNWTQGGSSVSTSASYTFTVTTNRTLIANFTQASYTITTSSNPVAGGTTTGGGGFNYGASVTVNATPASGFQFTNWTEGGTAVSTTASYVFTVTTSRNLLANFSLIPKVLNLTGSGGTVLHNNDIITLGSSDAGSFLITVDANAEWIVRESSIWFKAVKESNTSLRVTYMENISVIDKTASLKVTTALNAEMQINVSQKARVSQLNVSKFENIKLYPNPAFDHVFLYLGDELTGKLRISIASMQGTLFQTKEFTDIEANQIIDLDIAGMRTGQYLIKVSNESGQKILQMIKY